MEDHCAVCYRVRYQERKGTFGGMPQMQMGQINKRQTKEMTPEKLRRDFQKWGGGDKSREKHGVRVRLQFPPWSL